MFLKLGLGLLLGLGLGLRLGLDLGLHFLGNFSRRITCTVNISDCRYFSRMAEVPVTGTIYNAFKISTFDSNRCH